MPLPPPAPPPLSLSLYHSFSLIEPFTRFRESDSKKTATQRLPKRRVARIEYREVRTSGLLSAISPTRGGSNFAFCAFPLGRDGARFLCPPLSPPPSDLSRNEGSGRRARDTATRVAGFFRPPRPARAPPLPPFLPHAGWTAEPRRSSPRYLLEYVYRSVRRRHTITTMFCQIIHECVSCGFNDDGK